MTATDAIIAEGLIKLLFWLIIGTIILGIIWLLIDGYLRKYAPLCIKCWYRRVNHSMFTPYSYNVAGILGNYHFKNWEYFNDWVKHPENRHKYKLHFNECKQLIDITLKSND